MNALIWEGLEDFLHDENLSQNTYFSPIVVVWAKVLLKQISKKEEKLLFALK